MTATTPQSEGADSLLAAEYVLRLLMPPEERAFEKRLQNDRSLLGEVGEWTTRFAGMDAEYAEAAPRKRVKTALHARLFGADSARGSLLGRLWLWQGLSAASAAAVAMLAVQSMQSPQSLRPSGGPLFVSEVAAEDQSLRLLAVYDGDAGQLSITRTAGTAKPGRALELWAIPAGDGAAPVSLGVLPDGAKAGVVLPAALRGQVGDLTLAVSDEPMGGSPTGQPTGAVLAAGQVTDL